MDPAGRPGGDGGPARARTGQAEPAAAPTATATEASRAGSAQPAASGPLAPPSPRPPRARWLPARWPRSAVARHLVILVACIGAGIVVTLPRVTYLSGHELPGTRDAGAYVWGFWWFARQLAHLSNPWVTNYLAAPVGTQLGFHALMPLPSLLLTPVTLVFGPSASYNLLSVLMPGLLCYAMYRAARLWLRSETAALAAGAFFGLSSMMAYQSWYLVNLPAGELFIPLALESAVLLRRRPGWRRAVILGMIVGASMLTDQESAILVTIVTVLALLPWVFSGAGRQARGERPAQGETQGLRQLPGRLRTLALAAAVALVVSAPQLIAMAQQVAAHGATVPARALASSYTSYGVGLLGLSAPSPVSARFGLTGLASQYYYHGAVYHQIGPHHLVTSNEGTPMFGLVLTLLGVGGLIAARRRRNAWLLALMWLAAAALALGPVLWIGATHRYVPLAEMLHGVRVSAIMPYTWFVQIPGMSGFREADRLAVLGLLAAALLAGSAVDWLRYHAKPAMVAVLAASVLELGWAGNPPVQVMPASLQKGTMPTSMPRLDGPIAADHSGSIVVDFPFGLRGGIPDYGPQFAPEAQVLATADQHPIADGYIARVPAPTIRGLNRHPFYTGLVALYHAPGKPMPAAFLHAAALDARRMRVGWVIAWPTHESHALQHYLTGTGFRVGYRVGSTTVYRR
jgi:hypothetical protein